MNALSIQVEHLPEQVVVVRLNGEADVFTYKSLMDVAERLSQEKPRVVIFDMAGVQFVNSLSLGCMVKLRGELKSSGGSVRMANLKPAVQEMLSKSRLHWIIPVFPDLQMAIAATDQ